MSVARTSLFNGRAHALRRDGPAQPVVLGRAVALVVSLMTAELLGSVDRSQSGIASGTPNTLRQTGSVLGVALFGSPTASAGIAGGLHAGLAISIALLLCTGVLAFGIAR